MQFFRYHLRLRPQPRGFHLVTDEIVSQLTELSQIQTGLCHCLLQHSSASLLLNENADPTVRHDLEQWCQRAMRDREPYYQHTYEGPDDMSAHLKSTVFGTSLTLPIHQGRLALGTWQGIYLGEHRQHAGGRNIIVTLQGI
jgi:secondary thiamine-phosphate synthase enzyme